MDIENKWFTALDSRATIVLTELCLANINNTIKPTPEYLITIRRRMHVFLFNALAYNLNYKDLAHTNIEHMTNFFMYPLISTPKDKLYPFYSKVFANTLMINGGYLDHCDRKVVDIIEDNPFITRRDFDLALMYFLLTRKINLSEAACKSYTFKGSFNPLADVYRCFVWSLKITNTIPTRVSRPWSKINGYWHMPAPINNLSKRAIKIGLRYFGDNLLYLTNKKINSLVEYINNASTKHAIETKKVSIDTLISKHTGKYLIGLTCGLVINVREFHPYVYAWTAAGLYRFNDPMEYLYSEIGKTKIGHSIFEIIN